MESGTTDGNALVLVERRETILRIQLNRPQKKNALTPPMYDVLVEALNRADADETIHVVFITGSGDSFSAGNDLGSFLQTTSSDPTEVSAAGRFISTVSKTATPIVAAVNGIAVGVGVTMLLHCDLVYAADSAIFSLPFVDIGVVPEAGSTYLLPRLAGQRQAAELLLLGERFDANRAKTIGLVNGTVSLDELDTLAWQQAERLAAKPPKVLMQTKQLLRRGTAQVIAETIEVENQAFGERLASDETQQIIAALLQRRSR